MAKKMYTKRDHEKAVEALNAAKRAEMEIREQIEEREVRPKRLAYVGKCFKYRNNYSCPEKPSDYWWMWVRIVGVDDASLLAVKTQKDKYGKIVVERYRIPCFDGVLRDGYLPVTPKQYTREVAKLVTEVSLMTKFKRLTPGAPQ